MTKNRNENRPGYKKTKVGWIPEEWETSQIGSVLDLSKYGCSAPTVERGNTLVVGMKDIQNGEVHLSELVQVSLAERNRQTFLLKREDILINRTNSYDLVGKVGILNSDEEVGFVSYLVLLRGKRNVVKQKYMNYWLNSFPAQGAIKSIATKGVSQANVNPTVFKKYCYIPLPPLPEQKAIASVLECWDRVIQKYTEKIKKKKNIKKGLMQRLLSGKQRLPGFSGEWKEKRLGEIGQVITGSTPPKKDSQNYGGSHCWATAEDFTSKYINDTRHKLTEHGLQRARFLPIESVLITCIASIGLNAITRIPLATNQQINAVVVDSKKFSNEFVYYLITKNKQLLRCLAGSGAVPILSKNEFKKVKMCFPPLSEQKAIASILSSADSEIKTLERKLAVVKEQKKYLLNNLVTGTIRLPEFRSDGGG